jgi:hypothetical protein
MDSGHAASPKISWRGGTQREMAAMIWAKSTTYLIIDEFDS